jgi:5'-deoxynucleotidase YfbR-like HD superfamily hydrolase
MNLVEDPRAVGEALRYSTWRVIRHQSIGEHTWQVLRLLLTVWPEAPRNVIVYALMHDAGEMSGDIQYPFKKLFPELRAGADKAELHVRSMQRVALGAPETKHKLSAFEQAVFKCCDNLDMWEYGMREVNMGNLYARIIVKRMMSAVAGNLQDIQALKETQQFQQNPEVVPTIHRYIIKRNAMEDSTETETYDGK